MIIMDVLLEVFPRTKPYIEAIIKTKPKTSYRDVAVNNFLNYLYDIIPQSEIFNNFQSDIKGSLKIIIANNAIERLKEDVIETEESIINTLSNCYMNIVYDGFIGIKIYTVEQSEMYEDKIGFVKVGLFSTHNKIIKRRVLRDINILYKKYI